MAIAIIRWKCEYCRKHFASKNYAEKHEKICYYDGEKKACPTCAHFFNDRAITKCECLNREANKKPADFMDFLVFNCPHYENWEDFEERGVK